MSKIILALAGILSIGFLFPHQAHAQWDPNKRYDSVGDAVLDGAPTGAKVKLKNGLVAEIRQVQVITDPAAIRAYQRGERQANSGVTSSSNNNEFQAATDTGATVEDSSATLPNAGGEPFLLTVCGLLTASGAWLLRRRVS